MEILDSELELALHGCDFEESHSDRGFGSGAAVLYILCQWEELYFLELLEPLIPLSPLGSFL